MKHILVIGNGFDLAHGLNTGYKDFVNFCDIINNISKHGFNSYYKNNGLRKIFESKGFSRSVSQKAINYFHKNSEESKEFINLSQKNIWLNYVIKHQKSLGDKWCDLELIISDMIENLSYISNHIEIITNINLQMNNKNYQILMFLTELIKSSSHSKYKAIEDVKELLMNDLRNLTWLLEIYLLRFLNTRRKTLEIIKILPVTHVLSFNYTNTYKLMYDKENRVDYHYIHGQIIENRSIQDNNMVFGIGESINNATDNDLYDYLEFQKYYQRIIKKNGIKYKEWLNDKAPINMYIYGHSLNSVDGDVVRDLIKYPKASIYIFYYDQNALNSLVMNLIKCLGKDILIDLTSKNVIKFIKSDDVNLINEMISNKAYENNKQKVLY